MITLRFVTCSDLVSHAIRGAEMGFWASHVEALMLDGTLLGAHASGGVRARPYGYDAGKWTRELLVQVPSSDEQTIQWERWLYSQVGQPYDMVAMGELALGELTGEAPDWARSDSWICSALMTAGLVTIGVLKAAPTTVRLATPRDVLCMVAGLAIIGDPQAPTIPGGAS